MMSIGVVTRPGVVTAQGSLSVLVADVIADVITGTMIITSPTLQPERRTAPPSRSFVLAVVFSVARRVSIPPRGCTSAHVFRGGMLANDRLGRNPKQALTSIRGVSRHG